MSKPKKVVPAILTDKQEALKTLIQQAESFTDYAQIDIMDGKFVPSSSITYKEIDGLAKKLRWEVHLMTRYPDEQLSNYKLVGAQKAVFHFESTNLPQKVIFEAKKLGLEVGIAINPETPVSAIVPYINDVDGVLLLAVHPGFYGAKFIPEVLDKVAELRRIKPEIEIGLDGGVKENNIVEIAGKGVDVIFVGSAIFMQPQPGEAYRKLLSLVKDIK